MKKTRNYRGLFLIFFLIALLGFNVWKSVGKKNQQFGMDAPTIPLLRISDQGTELTDLHGYYSADAQAYAKGIAIPLGKSKELTVSLGPNLDKIESLTYTIYRKEDDKVVSKGKIQNFSADDEYLTAKMKVEEKLTEKVDYRICFTLSTGGRDKLYYYATLVYGLELHSRENMKFVKQFHKRIFQKSEDIIKNIESQEGATDSDFSNVTIKSSYNSIVFGKAEPVIETEISYEIRKIKEKNMTVELSYLVSIQREERSKQYYKVREIYEVAYSEKRMYLMDYERQMESIFNPEFIYPSRQEMLLGITRREEPYYLEADSGKKIAFVQGKQVWLFDYRNNTMAQVFAFNDTLDIRSNFDYSNIKLLKLDEKGNLDFLVYGYMTRGEHEGQNGISMYHYDAEKCILEEKIFIESNYKYTVLNSGIRQVGYCDEDGNLYLLLNGDLFKVTVDTNRVEKVEKGITEENIKISQKGKMVAIQKDKAKNNKEIILWNLETGVRREIICKDSQRIKLIGFISEDFVYGIANKKDLPKKGSTFPMKQIVIVDQEGEEVKEYKKENRYLLNAKASGNVIRVTLGKKTEGKYQKIPLQEYIRYQGETVEEIQFTRHSDNVQWSQLYMKFPNYIYLQNEVRVRKPGILS